MVYLVCRKCKHLKICREWLSLVNNKVNIATDNEYCTMFEDAGRLVEEEFVYIVHMQNNRYRLNYCEVIDRGPDDWIVLGILNSNNEIVESLSGNSKELNLFKSLKDAIPYYNRVRSPGGAKFE